MHIHVISQISQTYLSAFWLPLWSLDLGYPCLFHKPLLSPPDQSNPRQEVSLKSNWVIIHHCQYIIKAKWQGDQNILCHLARTYLLGTPNRDRREAQTPWLRLTSESSLRKDVPLSSEKHWTSQRSLIRRNTVFPRYAEIYILIYS